MGVARRCQDFGGLTSMTTPTETERHGPTSGVRGLVRGSPLRSSWPLPRAFHQMLPISWIGVGYYAQGAIP